jgi:tetratricopeptide (TPR) repeat protein
LPHHCTCSAPCSIAYGDLVGARKAIERSLAIKVKVYGTEEHPNVVASLYELGNVLEAIGSFGGACSKFERALSIADKCHGTRDHYRSAEIEVKLGCLLFRVGREIEARELIQHALFVLEKQMPDHFLLKQPEIRALAQHRPRDIRDKHRRSKNNF